MKLFPALVLFVGVLAVQSPAQENSTNLSAPAAPGSAALLAPLQLRPAEAKDHPGAQAIVTGPVAEVNRSDKVTRINFDHPFPNQTFTAVVFSSRTNVFGDLASLQGKTIEVQGRVNDFHGRAELILTETNQLRILEPQAGPH